MTENHTDGRPLVPKGSLPCGFCPRSGAIPNFRAMTYYCPDCGSTGGLEVIRFKLKVRREVMTEVAEHFADRAEREVGPQTIRVLQEVASWALSRAGDAQLLLEDTSP